MQILESLIARDPANAVVQLDLGFARANVGIVLAIAGDSKAGLALLNQAAHMFQAQIDRDRSYTEPQWNLAWTQLWTGEALDGIGRHGEALVNYCKVLTMWDDNPDPFLQTIVAGIYVKTAEALRKWGKRDQAAQAYRHALSLAVPIVATYPFIVDIDYVVADACSGLGQLSEIVGFDSAQSLPARIQHRTEARTWMQRSLDSWRLVRNFGSRMPIGLACGTPRIVGDHLQQYEVALRALKTQMN